LFGALIVHSPDTAVESSSTQTLGHEPHDLIKARHSRILPDDLTANVKRKDRPFDPTNGLLRVGSIVYDKEIVLLLHDWYHRTAQETIDWFQSIRSQAREVSTMSSIQFKAPVRCIDNVKQPVPDDVLLNGVQSYNCERSVRKIVCDKSKGSRPRLNLDVDKTYRLRLVNAGQVTTSLFGYVLKLNIPSRRAIATIHFSIDSHHLVLVEADGTLLSPVLLTEVSIAPGQRYSVILRPLNITRKHEEYLLRMRLDQS
jgi:FtsP/CotA-like multicopper oxidase with cupredoxin domain